MRFCKYCGAQIADTARLCPHCGNTLAPAPAKKTAPQAPAVKKPLPLIIGTVLLLAAAVLLLTGGGRCSYGSCKNKAISGYSYCYSHKCAISDCDDSAYLYSNYCFSHYLLYDDEAASSGSYVAEYELKISNVRLSSNSSYTVAEGSLTNNSDTTVEFVKIKGAFENSYGTVVDTDWTYAVGAEGLAPGETCKWRLSVDKDYTIKDCDVSILDYDY